MNEIGIAQRCDFVIKADASRVVTKLFIAGQELEGGSESRTRDTANRVMALAEDEVDSVMTALYECYESRHDNLRGVFENHAEMVSSFVTEDLSKNRRQLLGAAFTHEFSLEGAAVCNPSLVVHPDQHDMPEGGVRLVMSFRAIGEGHRSSICFRTCEIDDQGKMMVHQPKRCPVLAETAPAPLSRDVFHAALRDVGLDGDTAAAVLDSLDARFSREELQASIATVAGERVIRLNFAEMSARLLALTDSFYSATFDESTTLCQRTLWPSTPTEAQGVEDARFVEFHDPDCARYIASYTAYDGRAVSQQILETDDFLTFYSSPLAGIAAQNKGLAFFPRKINDRYVALSRYDRERNSLAFSKNLRHWDDVSILESPEQSWEMLQLGNCGSPIELEQGWLVITHGVGPMRTYGIGALLLDLNDPSKILGKLKQPLLLPNADEREGYVPNVVYSCGSLVHNGTLYLPYGASDESVRCAMVNVDALVAALVA